MEKESYAKIEQTEIRQAVPLYHHARALEHSAYGIVMQERGVDKDYAGAYEWVEHAVGFYPLFLAVGATTDDIKMTGYQNQWGRKLGPNLYRQKGDIQNQVLFSFTDVSKGVFMDDANWHIVLNSENSNYQITNRERSMIFRPSWSTSDWLRYARKNPHSVQMVVPELDLRKAASVSVRNKTTQQYMEQHGFQNVSVVRIKVDVFP